MNTRHWNWIQGLALAALLPLFAACSSEGDELLQGEEKQPVQVAIGTRATMDGDEWTWENGDQIGLNVTSHGATSSTNYTLTYNGSAWNDNSFTVTLPGTIEAWYPGGTGTSPDSFTIPTDQSTYTNLCKADFMTYNGKLDSMNPSLTLEHRLSKVTVTITNWEDYGETMPEISNFIIQTSGTITISDGIVAGSGSTDITPLHDETDKSYAAIVAPGSGFDIKLTVNGNDKTAHYDGSLDSGDAYSFNLTLAENELVFDLEGNEMFEGWGKEEDEEVIEAIN